MDVNPLAPDKVFLQPATHVVPLFQRPYVWTLDNQWRPMWLDIKNTAERCLSMPSPPFRAHFLGAIVLQQTQKPHGRMTQCVVIDGQQRLTTLQLLMDAVQSQLHLFGEHREAERLEHLVRNHDVYCVGEHDRFKLWPTMRDRAAFFEVMQAKPPCDYQSLTHSGSLLTRAHAYFANECRGWIEAAGPAKISERASALGFAIRELIQIVVITLTKDENAQEIFETLNARNTPLTQADLIKNLVFQRLTERGKDVAAMYDHYWKEFETGFWEVEVSAGRQRHSRASLFLNHWITARTGREIIGKDVYREFKDYVDQPGGVSIEDLVKQIRKAADIYRELVQKAESTQGRLDRLGLFAYRVSALESEVVRPLLLHLLDPDQPMIPEEQLRKALGVIESWMVRRMLIRVTSKSYTQVMVQLIQLVKDNRERAGEVVEEFFRSDNGLNRYWPDDSEVRASLSTELIYKRLSRGRLRMILEAIEDHLRGWTEGRDGLGGQRVPRRKFHIEHVMPQDWRKHWPLPATVGEAERNQLLQTLGNLTLLTQPVNSKVSNRGWLTDEKDAGGNALRGKRDVVHEHDVLHLNRRLIDRAGNCWDEKAIRERTAEMIDIVLDIWPVPVGHVSAFAKHQEAEEVDVTVSDLQSAGLIDIGARLYCMTRKFRSRVAVVLADGQVDVDGVAYPDLHTAARAISGSSKNGWSFFALDANGRTPLTKLVERLDDEEDVFPGAPDEDDETVSEAVDSSGA